MPTVGETGWGEIVNGNFTTIDTTMKGLSNRITTCESYGARITAIENEVNGNVSCTSVTTSGKITGNGGIAGTTGTFSGAVTGASFNGVPLKTSGVITVTPTSTYYTMPIAADDQSAPMILPFLPGSATYTGSIIVKMAAGSSTTAVAYYTDKDYRRGISIGAGASYTISFTGVKWLRVCYDSSSVSTSCTISGFNLS